MQPRIAEYPLPGHFLLHFSDTHLIAGDGNLYGGVSSDRYLKQIFSEVLDSGARPEAMIFTGDIADTGQAEAYRKIRTMAESVAEENGAQIIWAMGNHDKREHFYTELLGEKASSKPLDRVYDINGLRVIILDTSVPGHHYGEISQRQLNWLAKVLATPAKDGTILAMHHPPIPAVIASAVTVELRDQKNLEKVIAGSDIRSIIAGHLHYSCSATFAGIPVSVASSTCYTQDLNVKVGGTYGRDAAQSFNMMHVYNGTVLHSVVPAGKGELVGRFMSPEETAAIMKAEGISLPQS